MQINARLQLNVHRDLGKGYMYGFAHRISLKLENILWVLQNVSVSIQFPFSVTSIQFLSSMLYASLIYVCVSLHIQGKRMPLVREKCELESPCN